MPLPKEDFCRPAQMGFASGLQCRVALSPCWVLCLQSKGATRKMYKKFEAAIKVAGKDVISGSRGVFRLEAVGDSAEQVQDRVGEAPPPRWFHLAYVCLKPWRATLVELDRVNAMAERVLEDALPDPVFVRPLLEENKPRVLPLQVLVNELVLDWGYDIVHHSLSDSQTPMPVLRGHARVLPDLPDIQRVGEPLSDADEVASCDVSAASQSDSEDQLQTLLDAATANAPNSTSGDPHQSSQASDSEASGGEKAAPEEESQVLVTRNVQEETIRDWYGFRLTWVPPKKAAQAGAWQGTCPYHRKAGTGTQCKKTINVRKAGEQATAVAEALLLMKNWCVAAGNYDRHRHHMSLAVGVGGLAEGALDTAAAELQTERANSRVLRDDELDAQSASTPSAKQRCMKPARDKSQAQKEKEPRQQSERGLSGVVSSPSRCPMLAAAVLAIISGRAHCSETDVLEMFLVLCCESLSS